jgi:putative hydrolase of the HAD superfamily
MWSEAGHRLLTRTFPDHQVGFAEFGTQFHTGFPWHRQDHAHPELATPELWWDEIYRVYLRAFRHFGFADCALVDGLPAIRSDILDAGRYSLFDDVLPVLGALASKGWRQIVVSNHVPELAHVIAGLGISQFFHAVVTSGLVEYEKPHERIFEAALKHSVPGGPIWMIGDNVACDCLPARALGANAVLVRVAPSEYDCCAQDLWAALAIVQNHR